MKSERKVCPTIAIATLTVATLLSTAPVTTLAQQQGQTSTLNYTWAEIDYVRLDIEQVGGRASFMRDLDEGNGFGIRGSYELAPRWFVFANYAETESDLRLETQQGLFLDAETDVRRIDVGVGHYMPVLNDSSHAVFRAAYTDFERDRFRFGTVGGFVSPNLADDTSNGYFLDASIRSQLDQRFEGSLGVRYTDIDHTDDVGLIGNLIFEMSPELSAVFELEAASDLSQWLVGLRYNF